MRTPEGLYDRAARAHLRRDDNAPQPANWSGDELERIGGRDFVVLRNVRGVVAVFRYFRDRDALRFVEPSAWPEVAS